MQVPFLSLKDITEKYKDELHEAVLRVTDSGWYLQGNENKKFEDDYAHYIGTKYCVGVGNGLDALRLALLALGIKEGDEVIVPSNTYIATALAVSYVGAHPVLVDPDIDT